MGNDKQTAREAQAGTTWPAETTHAAPSAESEPRPSSAPDGEAAQADGKSGQRRTARRRPAGPSRSRIAANDDVPTIGGLIYALEQKPSFKPFQYAAIAGGVWAAIWLVLAWFTLGSAISTSHSFSEYIVKSNALLVLAAIVVPVATFFFLALLGWRAEELRLRSSTMTEVAIRLAEPDRMAEQSIASLGQAVRRQVSFMNDAVSRALGRAGELEALVHNEVAALERSYEDNERKIRALIQELAGERHALVNTSDTVTATLRDLGNEVPALIEKLSTQQITLAKIIESAGQNLTSLESAITQTTAGLETTVNNSAGRLEGALGTHATHLQAVLEDYTTALGVALGARTQQMQAAFEAHARSIDTDLGQRAQLIEQTLSTATRQIAESISSRSEQVEQAFASNLTQLDASLSGRTQALQTVFEEYGRALDTTLARRAEALDSQLVERTKTLDEAFSERLRLFDESILRSTMAIDSAVTERAAALTQAMDTHARELSSTLSKQAGELDETLMHGINSVRRTSEAITRQSIKAIEGLAGQSETLKNISENLLGQIGQVTGRFEQQGTAIMRAATQLETANYKIDSTLQTRHSELSRTLDRLTGKADEFGQFVQGYSSTIEGSIGEAERRARLLTDEMKRDAESRSRAALDDIERLKLAADSHTQRALEDLRGRVTTVSSEMTQQLGNMSSRFDATSEEVRQRAARAASELEAEQRRLRDQIDQLPQTAQSGAEAMRRALQDQLKAIEHLSELTHREAHRRDLSPPLPLPATDIPPSPPAPGPDPGDRARALNSLTSGLAQELAARHQPQATFRPEQMPPFPAAGRENWSLGDLLARASVEEEQTPPPMPAPPATAPPPPPAQTVAAPPPAFNVAQLARAIDGATAAAIWSKLRTGRRGVMVRSIYSTEGRETFDEVARRYAADPGFQATVNTYLGDFERILRDTEQQDASGRAAQAYANSETGRVYLFLAHASGRLS